MTHKEQALCELKEKAYDDPEGQWSQVYALRGIGYALLALLEHLEARQGEGAKK